MSFRPNYDSFYLKYANKTLDWLIMDTKELFEYNLYHRYNDLKKNQWIDNKIEYKFNSLGFRCDEFTDSNNLMFLGCSLTVGVGLPIETTFPYLISKELVMNCCNFGIGGSSSDAAFRYCHGYIDKIKPKIVFFAVPDSKRIELFEGDQIINAGPWTLKKYKDDYYTRFILNENNSYFNQQKNILAITEMCNERKIKFVMLSTSTLQGFSESLARDLSHPGITSHHLFANYVLTTKI